MSENQIQFLGLFILVALSAACIYLYVDNLRLRASITVLEKDKENLQDRVSAAEARQAAMLDVLKVVMQGEIKTARNEEREQIFATALRQLNAIERDINVSVIQQAEKAHAGQAAAGKGIAQAGE